MFEELCYSWNSEKKEQRKRVVKADILLLSFSEMLRVGKLWCFDQMSDQATAHKENL